MNMLSIILKTQKSREAIMDKMLKVEAHKRYGGDYINMLRYKADIVKDVRRSLTVTRSILGGLTFTSLNNDRR